MTSEIKFPLLFDGAMGTYYPDKSPINLPHCEMANLFDRDTILQIHKEYIEAGAQAIKTNTYQANTISLGTDFEVVKQIVQSAIAIAKEACQGTQAHIFANIGPIGPDEEVDIGAYKDLIDIFLDQGLDKFLFETFDRPSYLADLAAYIKAAKKEAFIITSFAVDADGYTRTGYSGQTILDEMSQSSHIDGLGFNCKSGPARLLDYISSLRLPDKPLSIMPNAGYPRVENGRTFYSNNKEYFATKTLNFLDYGIDIIGGCCGTSPDFIKEIADRLDTYTIADRNLDRPRAKRVATPKAPNHFLSKLKKKARPIAVEFDPPKDANMDRYLQGVRDLAQAGADAITIADCPVARVRVDASLTAYKIKNEIGIDPIVHMTCRDRNLNATKALLLGLNIENIQNLILVTGDPVPTAEKDEVKTVFQFNSTRLAAFVEEMNQTVFTNPMNIGGALNINAKRFDSELNRAIKKQGSGVTVFYTQPAISKQAVQNLKKARENLDAYIMGGIMPVVSYKNAVFLDAEISGISVDQDIIAMYKDADEDQAKKLAVDLAYHFSEEIKDYVDGYYIITPFSMTQISSQLIEKIKDEGD